MSEPFFVLVRPQLAENIGAVARAMRNFGLARLRLVAPRDGWPNPKAVAAASGAGRLLEDARVFEETAAAAADFTHLYATTVRPRGFTKRVLAPEAAMREAAAVSTIAEMRASGLFRVMQPADRHGDGGDFADYIVVAEELGAGCPSTAWIYANVVLKSWMVGMYPREAQEDIWGKDPDTIVSSILRPTGRSKPVEGGDRLSGRWSYVSGVDHTQWTIIGSVVMR